MKKAKFCEQIPDCLSQYSFEVPEDIAIKLEDVGHKAFGIQCLCQNKRVILLGKGKVEGGGNEAWVASTECS